MHLINIIFQMTDFPNHFIHSLRILFLNRCILIKNIIFINIFKFPNLFLYQLIRMTPLYIGSQRIYINKHLINFLFLIFSSINLLGYLFLQTVNLIFHFLHLIILMSTSFEHLFKLSLKFK